MRALEITKRIVLRVSCIIAHATILCGILGGRGKVAGPGGAGGNLRPDSTAGSVSGVRVRVRKSKLCERQVRSY